MSDLAMTRSSGIRPGVTNLDSRKENKGGIVDGQLDLWHEVDEEGPLMAQALDEYSKRFGGQRSRCQKEWKDLQSAVSQLAMPDGSVVSDLTLEGDRFVAVDDVGAKLRDEGTRAGSEPSYLAVFGRRPLKKGQVRSPGSRQHARSTLSTNEEQWHIQCCPAQTGQVWFVPELQRQFTTAGLTKAIFSRLREYERRNSRS